MSMKPELLWVLSTAQYGKGPLRLDHSEVKPATLRTGRQEAPQGLGKTLVLSFWSSLSHLLTFSPEAKLRQEIWISSRQSEITIRFESLRFNSGSILSPETPFSDHRAHTNLLRSLW